MERTRRCPLCGSKLSLEHYERVTRLDAARAKELHAAHLAARSAKRDAKEARRVGEAKGRDFEKRRGERLVSGLQQKLATATERIAQLQRGTTPQTEGLELEDKLAARLRREFPEDRIKREGKGGDILHTVIIKGRPAGLILYECKRYKTIKRDHVEQAARDKRARQADFAILVTTGTRRGFNGLAREGTVIIVAPLGVVALVGLVRSQLIEIARARLSRTERERAAVAALDYLTSPVFAGPLHEAIGKTQRARELLKKEYETHVRIWRQRWTLYSTIDVDLNNIAANVERVRDGSKPRPLERTQPTPLLLPAVTSKDRAT